MGNERGSGQLESTGGGDSQGSEAKYIKQEVITAEEHASKSGWQRRAQELGAEQQGRAYIQEREHDEEGEVHEHTNQIREEQMRALEQGLQQERSYTQGGNQQHHFSAFYTG